MIHSCSKRWIDLISQIPMPKSRKRSLKPLLAYYKQVCTFYLAYWLLMIIQSILKGCVSLYESSVARHQNKSQKREKLDFGNFAFSFEKWKIRDFPNSILIPSSEMYRKNSAKFRLMNGSSLCSRTKSLCPK